MSEQSADSYWASEAGRLAADNAWLRVKVNDLEAAERDMAAWREKYNDAVADRVAAECKLAKVLEGLSNLNSFPLDAPAEGRAVRLGDLQAIIKEARDEQRS